MSMYVSECGTVWLLTKSFHGGAQLASIVLGVEAGEGCDGAVRGRLAGHLATMEVHVYW